MPYYCRYSDGKTALSHNAAIVLEAEGVLLKVHDRPLDPVGLAYESMQVLQWGKGEGMQTVLTSKEDPGVRIVFEDKVLMKELKRRLPSGSNKGAWIWVPKGFWGCVLVGMLSLVLLYQVMVHVPQMVEGLVDIMPRRWEKPIGDYVFTLMVEEDDVIEDEKAQAAIQKVTEVLFGDEGIDCEILLVDSEQINAMALPGGKIVVFSGFIEFIDSPEELAGVLAHEMGHVRKRHNMKALTKAMLISYGLKSAGVNFGEKLVQTTLNLAYSREHEREADLYAAKILESSGVGTQGMIRFFEKIDKKMKEKGKGEPRYFSSHPKTQNRIEDLKGRTLARSKPLLSKEEWGAVKAIVAEKVVP